MALEHIFRPFKNSKSNPARLTSLAILKSYEAYLQSMMEDAWDYGSAILAGGDRSERGCCSMVTSLPWITPTSSSPSSR